MNFIKRIYEDYFKRSRLNNYRKMLLFAREKGYKMVGILDFYKLVKNDDPILHGGLILINRHDIDTSPRVARMLFEIEKEVYGNNGSATYYFRKSTIDTKLINEIDAYGYETGFHYETIANFEKKHKYRDSNKIRDNFKIISNVFEKEIEQYRQITGSLSKTISSHGDFVNVKLKLANYELLNNRELREKTGVICEAYDEIINKHVKKRFADQILLGKFADTVIQNLNFPIILLLTHPRQWKIDIFWNTKDNFCRLLEGIKYKC